MRSRSSVWSSVNLMQTAAASPSAPASMRPSRSTALSARSVSRSIFGGIAPEGMTFNKNGTVVIDPVTGQTTQNDIFAGGDFVTGPKFAIDAIAAGRVGAESLHRFVNPGQSLTLGRNRREFIELDKEEAVIPIGFDNAPRQVPGHDAAKAKTFSNDHLTFTEEQIRKEASRCLAAALPRSTRTSASAAASAPPSASSTPSTSAATCPTHRRCTRPRTR